MSKILLVGAAGHQGQEYFKILSKKHEIVALADENINSLNSLYSNSDISLFANTSDAIASGVDFNEAIVCVPHYLHKKIALQLLNAGKTVIKEKPLAIQSSEIDEYKSVMINSKNSRLMTIVQRNFSYPFVNASKDIKLLGRIYSYEYLYNLNVPVQTSGWRASFDKSFGGVLIDMGYHILDIIISYFDKPISTFASASYCYDDMRNEQLEDSIHVILNHRNEISGAISLNRHTSKKEEVFRILGSNGTMEITPNGYIILDRQNNEILKVGYVNNSTQVKLDMFDTYLNKQNDDAFLQSHFNHHCNVVDTIERIYANINRTKEIAA